jgi:hypothetical protein
VYNGITRDTVNAYPGLIWPAAHFTPNGGGHSGLVGDYAMDMATGGGAVHVNDASFLAPAAASNAMTFAFWCKKYDTANCSAFWVNSPSSSGTSRGFQAHLPWGGVVYYDTAGCCDGALYRISANINTFSGYVDDGFWTNWHHYVFLYNAGAKQIWIDGTLFLEGNSSAPLPSDWTDMYIGRDPGDNLNIHALMDDFAAYSTPLTPANIALLAAGTAPNVVTGEKLLAYWNFNDPPAGRPVISIAKSGASLVITYTGTLQSASNVEGQYTDVFGAGNPYTTPINASPMKFYRARQ